VVGIHAVVENGKSQRRHVVSSGRIALKARHCTPDTRRRHRGDEISARNNRTRRLSRWRARARARRKTLDDGALLRETPPDSYHPATTRQLLLLSSLYLSLVLSAPRAACIGTARHMCCVARTCVLTHAALRRARRGGRASPITRS